MVVGDIRNAIKSLEDWTPVTFLILRGPANLSITTFFRAESDRLEVLFDVEGEVEADDDE